MCNSKGGDDWSYNILLRPIKSDRTSPLFRVKSYKLRNHTLYDCDLNNELAAPAH
jgi:hypothetical protein